MCAAIRFMSRWKPSVPMAVFILFFFGILPTPTRAQRKAITQDKYIHYQRDFLHVFHPGLSDKKYWITIETSEPYENMSAGKRSSKTFLVDIGDGRKSEVLMCCFGGSMGEPLGSNVPYDKELGPPHPPPPPPQPIPRPDRRNIDSNGAVHPTQYLSTEFVFDSEGHLKTFNVAKEKQPDGVWDFWEKLRLNPDMSDAELKAAYKASGAKYSLGDRETFKRELPVSQLEPFLGTLKVIQIAFHPITVERLNKLGGFSDCEVELEGPNKKQYLAYFAAYSGRLITVLYLTEKEMELRKKGTN